MKTGFLFIADHLLVGQLCTNPKSDRSLLSCLKVTQCSTSEIGDAPLYNSTDPSYDNRTIASTLKIQIWIATNNRDVPKVIKTKFPAMVMVFGVVSSEGHIMSAWKSTPKCTWMCWRVWWSPSAIRWPVADPGCGSRTRRRLQKECNDFVPFFHWPHSSDLNPLVYFVWSYDKNITNMTSHNTKASLITAIR